MGPKAVQGPAGCAITSGPHCKSSQLRSQPPTATGRALLARLSSSWTQGWHAAAVGSGSGSSQAHEALTASKALARSRRSAKAAAPFASCRAHHPPLTGAAPGPPGAPRRRASAACTLPPPRPDPDDGRPLPSHLGTLRVLRLRPERADPGHGVQLRTTRRSLARKPHRGASLGLRHVVAPSRPPLRRPGPQGRPRHALGGCARLHVRLRHADLQAEKGGVEASNTSKTPL